MHQKDDELIQATATADELTVLSRTSLVAVAASFLLIGVAASVYGPLLAVLSHRFAISLPVAGQVFSAHFAQALLGVLVINLYGKTGVTTRAGATLFALERDLVQISSG